MVYTPTEWKNGVTPINETNLNKIEEGIAEAHEDIEGIYTAMTGFWKGVEAGQVIMAESVDETGKVTWKPVEHYHMKNEAVLSWDGNTSGLEYIEGANSDYPLQYLKISDIPLHPLELIGYTAKFMATSGEVVTQVITEDLLTQEDTAVHFNGLLVSVFAEITLNDVNFTPGLWHLSKGQAGGYVSEIFKEVPVKIPEKFLPGGSVSLPSVTEADNGEHLEVVNGNWEVVPFNNSALKTSVEALIDAYIEEALGGDY